MTYTYFYFSYYLVYSKLEMDVSCKYLVGIKMEQMQPVLRPNPARNLEASGVEPQPAISIDNIGSVLRRLAKTRNAGTSLASSRSARHRVTRAPLSRDDSEHSGQNPYSTAGSRCTSARVRARASARLHWEMGLACHATTSNYDQLQSSHTGPVPPRGFDRVLSWRSGKRVRVPSNPWPVWRINDVSTPNVILNVLILPGVHT
ncbi:hypothetical protein F4802DRAFT_547501 [Xylaria palmicola]|nr:hypothetical protein F4802DRAFT_547501 [Xylaria palmicola]